MRLLHWALAASIVAAWLTRHDTGPAHEYIGYASAAVVAARLAWGRFGNRYARFAHFVRGPAPTWQYLRAVMAGGARRHLGHNPLGGAMVVALLSCVGLVALSGWALGTDLLWGYAWPVRIHEALSWLLVGLVVLHVAGVIHTSWHQRENLVAAMITGDKIAPRVDDAD